MVREASNEALCSLFIADVLVQDLNTNISASRRRADVGPTLESTLLGFHTNFSVRQ